MVKSVKRSASEAGVGGCLNGEGGGHKMQLRKRTALGDISNGVRRDGGGPVGNKVRRRKAPGFTIYGEARCSNTDDGSKSTMDDTQSGDAANEERGLRKRVAREASRKLTRETFEQKNRCKMPEPQLSEHDLDDKDNPDACAEYVLDMYRHFKELEEKYTPTVYMHTQADINCKMRAILIDWIVEVHLKFKLADPTLYLTCHIIDRFLMLEEVHRSKLQLVGVTALLVACKYEEIYPTEVRDCVYITDHAYSREEVLAMEQKILRRLKFEISVPTAWTFLIRFNKVSRATDRQHNRSQYYLERCLQEHDSLCFRPSLLAAAAVFLSRILDMGVDEAWNESLASFLNIPRDSLESCARMIIKFLKDEPVTASRRLLVAVKKKFVAERFLAVGIDQLPVMPAKPAITATVTS
ncbi:unnamed protein product [Discosporangium mesarthrocarpum]